jgi:hypothetical protein
MLWAAALPMAIAQDRSLGSVVVFPIVFSKDTGSPTSQKTGVNAVREVMQKAGYTLISNTVAANAWRKMGLTLPSTDNPANVSDIVRFGKAIHAHYVVTPVFSFHTRSIWVDLGPKTVSTATVDIVITDVDQGKTPHEQRAVQIAVAKALRDWVHPEQVPAQ